jgi:hypothetical protein
MPMAAMPARTACASSEPRGATGAERAEHPAAAPQQQAAFERERALDGLDPPLPDRRGVTGGVGTGLAGPTSSLCLGLVHHGSVERRERRQMKNLRLPRADGAVITT